MAKKGRPKLETKDITRQRIDEIRMRLGVSKTAFAKILGKDPSAIRKWINGNLHVPSEALLEIAILGDVQIPWLLGETDEEWG
jgi:DNA-binding transcriptional regulator YiaG